MISICLERMSPGKKAALAATGVTGTALAAPELGAAVSQKLGQKSLETAARSREGITTKQLEGWKDKARTVKGRKEIESEVTGGTERSAEAGKKALKQYDMADTLKSISPSRILSRYARKTLKAARKAHDEAQG